MAKDAPMTDRERREAMIREAFKDGVQAAKMGLDESGDDTCERVADWVEDKVPEGAEDATVKRLLGDK